MGKNRYVKITGEQMASLFKGSKGWTLAKDGYTKELVYEFKIPSCPHIVVKVYTSIKDNKSHRKGSDAIRVCAVNTDLNVGWIKSKHIKRVMNWENNLKDRVIEVIKSAKNRKS